MGMKKSAQAAVAAIVLLLGGALAYRFLHGSASAHPPSAAPPVVSPPAAAVPLSAAPAGSLALPAGPDRSRSRGAAIRPPRHRSIDRPATGHPSRASRRSSAELNPVTSRACLDGPRRGK